MRKVSSFMPFHLHIDCLRVKANADFTVEAIDQHCVFADGPLVESSYGTFEWGGAGRKSKVIGHFYPPMWCLAMEGQLAAQGL